MPSNEKGVTGGAPEFIEPLASCAASLNVAGFFIETHPNPLKALSDAKSMLPLNKMEALLTKLMKIYKAAE